MPAALLKRVSDWTEALSPEKFSTPSSVLPLTTHLSSRFLLLQKPAAVLWPWQVSLRRKGKKVKREKRGIGCLSVIVAEIPPSLTLIWAGSSH